MLSSGTRRAGPPPPPRWWTGTAGRHQGPGEESEDAYDKKQDEDREAPLSAAAAMLNIFRSIPTQMVGQPPPEDRPRPGPRPLVAAGDAAACGL